MSDTTIRASVALDEDDLRWQLRFFALPRPGDTIEDLNHCDDWLRVVKVNWAPIPGGSFLPTLHVERVR